MCSQLDLSSNQLCCSLDYFGDGTYTAKGIMTIAGALQVNASLTMLDVRLNSLGNEGEALLQQAVQGRSGFDLKMTRSVLHGLCEGHVMAGSACTHA